MRAAPKTTALARRGFCRLGLAAAGMLPLAERAVALDFSPGANSLMLRGVRQSVPLVPHASHTALRGKVLFMPGDGGWRGRAVEMARHIASWGFDVYGFDTLVYLEGFTGETVLTESDIVSDVYDVAGAIAPGAGETVILMGWSEGAGMVAAAAAGPRKEKYAGVVALGLGNENVRAWRTIDAISYLTGREPKEPKFFIAPYMERISPVPLVQLQADGDTLVRPEEARDLFGRAREPKKFVLVHARNHGFYGDGGTFFPALEGAFEWVLQRGN